MTGYQSKKKAASAKTIDEVNWLDHEPDGRRAAQESASVTYKEVADAMNQLRGGTFEQRQIALEMENKRLYTTLAQRPWVEPTGNEWFEWWRVSKIADETEAEIDFADFFIIAQAVVAKLKEHNNG